MHCLLSFLSIAQHNQYSPNNARNQLNSFAQTKKALPIASVRPANIIYETQKQKMQIKIVVLAMPKNHIPETNSFTLCYTHHVQHSGF